MKIAVLGAGFTGLAASLRLLQNGHQVTLIEKEKEPGGLAGGFKRSNWEWSLEKTYHHWFTNDDHVLNLASELHHPVVIKRPSTDVYIQGNRQPFDSPTALLKFSHLPLTDRLRTGLVTFYLKYLANPQSLEGKKALPWVKRWMGKKAANLIWEPLFIGKFGKYKEDIALTWFWARIKKRTPSLAYPQGGYQVFADAIAQRIEKLGGKIVLGTEISQIIKKSSKIRLEPTPPGCNREFDKIIVTLPTPIFTRITPNLPTAYVEKVASIPHLHALNMILVLKKPFMEKTYWLNITDIGFPFLVLAEHTNFMDKKHYGGEHILYIGNYLPSDHPYLKMTASQLLRIFDPYLKKINPHYQQSVVSCQLFSSPFAQPIVTPNYPQLIPQFKTPLKDIYLANMDMVYPWDRGTNYAVEMGEKIAELVDQDN